MRGLVVTKGIVPITVEPASSSSYAREEAAIVRIADKVATRIATKEVGMATVRTRTAVVRTTIVKSLVNRG